MARTVELPIKIELTNAWVVRPGDVLVLGFAAHLTPDHVAQIRERFAEKLPGVQLAIIDSIAHMAVYKPEPEEPVSEDGQP